MRSLLKAVLAISILSAGFLSGFNLSPLLGSSLRVASPLLRLWRPSTARAEDSQEVAPPDAYVQALGAIRKDYLGVDRSDEKAGDSHGPVKLTYAAIEGMLATIGDRYTEFWTPEEYRDSMQETSGSFVGVGAHLDVTKDRRVVITEPMENSPASRAGIMAGDIITFVDGVAVMGQDLQKVIDRIRGAEGTYVKLTIERQTKSMFFNLRRSVISSPIVTSRMADPIHGIGYIQLAMFNEQADKQFDAALSRLEKQNMRALVFDLRNNPGGLLQVAQDLASRFIESGPIVWVIEKNGHVSSMNVESDKHRSPLYRGAYPVVVLVNGGSASAAEIVAGAIQDAGAGEIVGTSTYGKGLVQTIMPLADDSAVKITTQHYFTRNKHDINIPRDPSGRALNKVGGITPDVVVDFGEKEMSAQREAARRAPQDPVALDRLDPQLARAEQILTTKLNTVPITVVTR